jgi:hypothetical protein
MIDVNCTNSKYGIASSVMGIENVYLTKELSPLQFKLRRRHSIMFFETGTEIF